MNQPRGGPRMGGRSDYGWPIREVVRRIQAHESVTDAQRSALGITVRDAEPTPAPGRSGRVDVPATEYPLAAVVGPPACTLAKRPTTC